MAKQASKLDKAPMEEGQSGRLQAVSIAMQQIEKEFGKGSIMRMGESMKT
jgi:RecA/RadA recombinase